jgi:NAD-dependent DNA ligase
MRTSCAREIAVVGREGNEIHDAQLRAGVNAVGEEVAQLSAAALGDWTWLRDDLEQVGQQLAEIGDTVRSLIVEMCRANGGRSIRNVLG